MALIQTVSPERAEGETKEVYDILQKNIGLVPAPMELASVSPGMLKMAWQSIQYYTQHPTLGFGLLSTIRYLVALQYDFAFCTSFTAELRQEPSPYIPKAANTCSLGARSFQSSVKQARSAIASAPIAHPTATPRLAFTIVSTTSLTRLRYCTDRPRDPAIPTNGVPFVLFMSLISKSGLNFRRSLATR